MEVGGAHFELDSAVLGDVEDEVLHQLDGGLIHDGQRRALQLAAEVDVKVVEHLLGSTQGIPSQQGMANVTHGQSGGGGGEQRESVSHKMRQSVKVHL